MCVHSKNNYLQNLHVFRYLRDNLTTFNFSKAFEDSAKQSTWNEALIHVF